MSLPKHFVTPEKAEHHAQILSNRIRNRYRHLSRRFRKQGIECFRLYDWDIPEVRAVVDWYAGHVVIAEYERLQTGPWWLPRMALAVAETLKLSMDQVYVKRRRTGPGKEDRPRYSRLDSRGERFPATERDLKFWINLNDFLDTGLYSDHRNTRVLIREIAQGKDFLNLFAYTGAFTCAAAAGGAKTTVTVDRSETYLQWAQDNLKLNELWGTDHELIQSDVPRFLSQAQKEGRRFDLAFVDPPSFYKEQSRDLCFDINEDHPGLLKSVLRLMKPGSTVFFSTNHQRFEPRFEGLPVQELKELTPRTIPEDYRNRKIHRCWRMISPARP
ncbi:MAG: class I SAM-dependent methyltransferase [Candidatus Omnitrophica bacterium]|nr:class I SAM-dependent methyltransferase [Candidatus Omnitrophota bacterium]